jgi:hypothetical protein
MSAREHLDWSSDQALRFYEDDSRKAVLVFLILVDTDTRTRWIVSHPGTEMLMMIGMSSRYEMERMMKGFAA